MTEMIPLCKPNVGTEELEAIRRVLESGWLTHGPLNSRFEREFASYIGVKHAVTLNSCTSALFLAIVAQEIKGDVLVPSFTFVASANAIVTAGARPVLVDIDYDTCTMDVADLERKIGSSSEAIMPVHYAGQSCDMVQIGRIATRYGLKIIEDSAETIGGECAGQKTGTFGVGCFSFFPTKNMTTGEGGMLTTDDGELANKVRTYAAHGILPTSKGTETHRLPWNRSAIVAGHNFRMSNVQAGMGVEQLKKLDRMNALRREHAAYISNRLETLANHIDLPVEREICKHVYQMYTIKLKTLDRDKFVGLLRKQGIEASVHFTPPVHLQPFYRKLLGRRLPLPVTEQVAKRIVTLPMYPQLTEGELERICSAVERTVSILASQ